MIHTWHKIIFKQNAVTVLLRNQCHLKLTLFITKGFLCVISYHVMWLSHQVSISGHCFKGYKISTIFRGLVIGGDRPPYFVIFDFIIVCSIHVIFSWGCFSLYLPTHTLFNWDSALIHWSLVTVNLNLSNVYFGFKFTK